MRLLVARRRLRQAPRFAALRAPRGEVGPHDGVGGTVDPELRHAIAVLNRQPRAGPV